MSDCDDLLTQRRMLTSRVQFQTLSTVCLRSHARIISSSPKEAVSHATNADRESDDVSLLFVIARAWLRNGRRYRITIGCKCRAKQASRGAHGALQLDHFGSQLNTANCSATRSPAACESLRSIGSSSRTLSIHTCNKLAAKLQRCLARGGTLPAQQV
jgi:hypothetical protein